MVADEETLKRLVDTMVKVRVVKTVLTCRTGACTELRGDVLHGHYDNPCCISSFEAKARRRLRRGERACPWLLVEGSTDKHRQAF